jgi:hypothetical protein
VAGVGLTPAALTVLYRWPLESRQLDEFGNHDNKLVEPPHKVGGNQIRANPRYQLAQLKSGSCDSGAGPPIY